MSAGLDPVVAALEGVPDSDLHVLIAATNQASQIAPGQLAWIEVPCDWELNRRAGADCDLQPPEAAIPREEDAVSIDAAIATTIDVRDEIAPRSRVFDVLVELLPATTSESINAPSHRGKLSAKAETIDDEEGCPIFRPRFCNQSARCARP
jgi:hypothetical protein